MYLLCKTGFYDLRNFSSSSSVKRLAKLMLLKAYKTTLLTFFICKNGWQAPFSSRDTDVQVVFAKALQYLLVTIIVAIWAYVLGCRFISHRTGQVRKRGFKSKLIRFLFAMAFLKYPTKVFILENAAANNAPLSKGFWLTSERNFKGVGGGTW